MCLRSAYIQEISSLSGHSMMGTREEDIMDFKDFLQDGGMITNGAGRHYSKSLIETVNHARRDVIFCVL